MYHTLSIVLDKCCYDINFIPFFKKYAPRLRGVFFLALYRLDGLYRLLTLLALFQLNFYSLLFALGEHF